MNQKRLWLASALLLALGTAAPRAHACACGGQGPESSLTTRAHHYGLRISELLETGYGFWSVNRGFERFGPKTHDVLHDYSLLVALRPSLRWEVSARTTYGQKWLASGATSATSSGFGDSSLRVRYEAVDEDLSRGLHLPSLVTSFEIKAPTGEVTRSVAHGLGAFELALGARLEHSLGDSFRAGISGMGAYRLPDKTLFEPRQLGPRAFAEVSATYSGPESLVFTLLANLNWEADTIYSGQVVRGTSQRIFGVAGMVGFLPGNSPFRAGLVGKITPPFQHLSANAIATTLVEVWVGYVR